jgi:hypothetical protein
MYANISLTRWLCSSSWDPSPASSAHSFLCSALVAPPVNIVPQEHITCTSIEVSVSQSMKEREGKKIWQGGREGGREALGCCVAVCRKERKGWCHHSLTHRHTRLALLGQLLHLSGGGGLLLEQLHVLRDALHALFRSTLDSLALCVCMRVCVRERGRTIPCRGLASSGARAVRAAWAGAAQTWLSCLQNTTEERGGKE